MLFRALLALLSGFEAIYQTDRLGDCQCMADPQAFRDVGGVAIHTFLNLLPGGRTVGKLAGAAFVALGAALYVLESTWRPFETARLLKLSFRYLQVDAVQASRCDTDVWH